MDNNNIKLSILICSVENVEREENLKKIIHELKKQISENYAENIVEILVEKDNGTISVGKKRNLLIEKAQGEYICFIDDDDFISINYINTILQNLTKDILIIRIQHIVDGIRVRDIQPSLYIDNLETTNVVFKNNHLHLCPHKRSIALYNKFNEINFAEDLQYSQSITRLITSYDIILDETPLYIYNDNQKKSLTRNV